MCGRSCVRAFSPSSEQWSKACSSPAQPRRYAGVWAGPCGPGSRKSGSGCEREEKTERRSCEARPPFNGRRRAHGRAEALRPLAPPATPPPEPARVAVSAACACRAQLPRGARASRGRRPGSQGDLQGSPAFPARLPTRQRVFPPLARGLQRGRGQGRRLLFGGRERHESAIRKGFCDREAEVLLFGFPGSEGGAAGACMGDAWW